MGIGTPIDRLPSPWRAFSILMPSAPRSPRNIAANGPAAAWLKSSTRMPDNGRAPCGGESTFASGAAIGFVIDRKVRQRRRFRRQCDDGGPRHDVGAALGDAMEFTRHVADAAFCAAPLVRDLAADPHGIAEKIHA